MPDAAIQVEGLRELNAALRKLGEKELPKEFKRASKRAAQVVAVEAAARVPKRTGKLAASIRGAAQARGAVVRAGRESVPYAGWIEFGGTIQHKTDNWSSTRPFIKQGRYIFPAAKAKEPQVVELFEAGVSHALRSFR